MRKKGIVLLITLFFITAISVLIFQNLKDTDKFIKEVSFDNSLSQIQITMGNIKDEIPKYLVKNKDNIEEILENSQAVPLSYGNVNLILNIEEYIIPQFNINNLTTQDTVNEEFLNNINYKYDFLQIVNKNKPHTNNNQVKQTIKEYIKLKKDKNILNIAKQFTYISDKNISKLISCNYTLKVNDINSEVNFIFDLNSSKIQDFNIVNIF